VAGVPLGRLLREGAELPERHVFCDHGEQLAAYDDAGFLHVRGAGAAWRPGDRVHHRRFGTGVVLACQGRGAQLKLVVYFDRAGRKTLVPTIAKLERV